MNPNHPTFLHRALLLLLCGVLLAGCLEFGGGAPTPSATIGTPIPAGNSSLNLTHAEDASGRIRIKTPQDNAFVRGLLNVSWSAPESVGALVSARYAVRVHGNWTRRPLSENELRQRFFELDTTQLADPARIWIEVHDPTNKSLSHVVEVIVDNAPPLADCGGNYSAREGEKVPLSASLSRDAESGIAAYSWSFGKQGRKDAGTENATAELASKSGSSAWRVFLTVTDKAGNSANATCAIDFSNVAPAVYAGSGQSAAEGSAVTLKGSFYDPGSQYGEQYNFTWEFGDGVVEMNANLTATHVYQTPGLYTARLTVADSEAEASNTTTVNVSNVKPSAANLTHAWLYTEKRVFFSWDVLHPPGTTIFSRIETLKNNNTDNQNKWSVACETYGRPYQCMWNATNATPAGYGYRVVVSDGMESAAAHSSNNVTIT